MSNVRISISTKRIIYICYLIQYVKAQTSTTPMNCSLHLHKRASAPLFDYCCILEAHVQTFLVNNYTNLGLNQLKFTSRMMKVLKYLKGCPKKRIKFRSDSSIHVWVSVEWIRLPVLILIYKLLDIASLLTILWFLGK